MSLCKIEYVCGMKDYVNIFIKNEKRPLVTHITMKVVENMLPKDSFMRVHRSYIVSIKKVISIQNKVLYLKDEEIPIGETYKNVILEFFKV